MTLKLFYAHGSSSLGSHFALEESGAHYDSQRVDLPSREQHTPAYRSINPRGRVPALQLGDGSILTENVAIQYYVATSFPDARLLPTAPAEVARVLSLSAFFAATVHVAHRQLRQPNLYTTEPQAEAAIKAVGRKTFHERLEETDGLLRGREWFFDQYTTVDAYALYFYWCGVRQELPVHELTAYTAHARRVLKRPAIARVLEQDPAAGPALRKLL